VIYVHLQLIFELINYSRKLHQQNGIGTNV